jgi:hypothetical protein
VHPCLPWRSWMVRIRCDAYIGEPCQAGWHIRTIRRDSGHTRLQTPTNQARSDASVMSPAGNVAAKEFG